MHDTPKPYQAHSTAIIDGETVENGYRDPNIGAGTCIWHFSHVSAGAHIGTACMLGQGVYVGPGAVIGSGCRIQNHVSLFDGVMLEDQVFCGPSVTFTNLSNPLPRAAVSRRDRLQTTRVRSGASIGAGAVILCGIDIGHDCFVAAGAVVTRDVPPYALVMGNPARIQGWVCRCGARLVFDRGMAFCEGTGEPCRRRYIRRSPSRIECVDDAGGA